MRNFGGSKKAKLEEGFGSVWDTDNLYVLASDGSNLSTSLFKNEKFRMKYEKTGCSKLKYAYRVPLMISVRGKGGNKRNS